MKRLVQILLTTLLLMSISVVALGGTITGSRTARTGTITGSRAGTITGSRTGTITGSRFDGIGSGTAAVQNADGRYQTNDWLARLLMLILNPYF
jgi:hypothetical protein